MALPKDDLGGGWGRRQWVNVTLYERNPHRLDDKVEEYFKCFAPQGYDTHITQKPKCEGDYWSIKIRRWSTCG
jgi:hypothetical protein